MSEPAPKHNRKGRVLMVFNDFHALARALHDSDPHGQVKTIEISTLENSELSELRAAVESAEGARADDMHTNSTQQQTSKNRVKPEP